MEGGCGGEDTHVFESKRNYERKALFTLNNMIDVARNLILNPTL